MKYKINTPKHYGNIVEERLKVLEIETNYEGFTLDENLNIIKTKCSIENNGRWNYHNNYDNSENVLKVGNIEKWWTLSEKEIKKVQKENLDNNINIFTKEIKKLKSNYS